MDITAFIMGICPPHRLEWLKQTIDDLDSQNFPFSKKIIAIDEFGGYTFPPSHLKYYTQKGWSVLIDSHRSRAKTMTRALSEIDSEWVFYHEDDVMVKLPDYKDLCALLTIDDGDRKCGMISMNTGGSTFDAPAGNLGDIKFMEKNTLLKNNKYVIFKRLEEYKSAWFLSFPALFIKTHIFKGAHAEAMGTHQQIEMGLTSAYFKKGYDKDYYKCTVAQPDMWEKIKEDLWNIDKNCNLLTILDPRQGSNPCAGGHNYSQ